MTIQIELKIDNYIIATELLQVLMDYKIIQGFYLERDGHYRLSVESWKDIPDLLYPFIDKSPIAQAEEKIRDIISFHKVLQKQQEEYQKNVELERKRSQEIYRLRHLEEDY